MRLVQIAQRAEVLTRAAAFYTDLLGAAPIATYDPPGLLFFDLDATVRRLRDAGVTDEWQAFVRDSEGNLVGLVEQSTLLVRGQATMSA